jgi:hypothetical protein
MIDELEKSIEQLSFGTKDKGKATFDKSARKCKRCGEMADPGKLLMVCGQCRVVYYCSVDCQQKHWLHHKVYSCI